MKLNQNLSLTSLSHYQLSQQFYHQFIELTFVFEENILFVLKLYLSKLYHHKLGSPIHPVPFHFFGNHGSPKPNCCLVFKQFVVNFLLYMPELLWVTFLTSKLYFDILKVCY